MRVIDLFKECNPERTADIFNTYYMDDITKLELQKSIKEQYPKIAKKDRLTFGIELRKKRIIEKIKEIIKISPIKNYNHVILCYKCEEESLEDDGKINEFFDVCSIPLSKITRKASKKQYYKTVQELKKAKDFSNPFYCFMFEKPRDLLGYYISKELIKDIGVNTYAAHLLHEMTWFGWNFADANDRIDEEKETLIKRAKEVEDHPENLHTIDLSDFDLQSKEKTKEEKKKEKELRDALMLKNANLQINIMKLLYNEFKKED